MGREGDGKVCELSRRCADVIGLCLGVWRCAEMCHSIIKQALGCADNWGLRGHESAVPAHLFGILWQGHGLGARPLSLGHNQHQQHQQGQQQQSASGASGAAGAAAGAAGAAAMAVCTLNMTQHNSRASQQALLDKVYKTSGKPGRLCTRFAATWAFMRLISSSVCACQ